MWLMLCRGFGFVSITSFLSYFPTLTPLVSELGYHVGINFKYMYIYIYIEFAWLSGGPFQCKILAMPPSAVVQCVSIKTPGFNPILPC